MWYISHGKIDAINTCLDRWGDISPAHCVHLLPQMEFGPEKKLGLHPSINDEHWHNSRFPAFSAMCYFNKLLTNVNIGANN